MMIFPTYFLCIYFKLKIMYLNHNSLCEIIFQHFGNFCKITRKIVILIQKLDSN